MAESASLSGPTLFQQREDLLFRTGYRLATANARFCGDQSLATGLLLHDAESYGDPAEIRRSFALTGDIGIQSVAPGSPAYLAGLRRNDTILSIGRQAISESFPPSKPGWRRLKEINDQMDAILRSGSLELTWRDSEGTVHEAVVGAIAACATRFELVDESRVALADGGRVMLGQNFPAFGYGEEEFAAAVAHELAHNILAHVKLLDELGRKQSNIRLSERDADRLMPWLLANAGYDPAAAVRFMTTWGPSHGGGLLRKRTHDGWDERVEFIREEIRIIDANRSADGKANWKLHFRPMLGTSEAR